MKIVNMHAKVNMERCKGCKTCENVCPVYAVEVKRRKQELTVTIDETRCVGCWNCQQRCPEYAIDMVPCEARELSTDVSKVDYSQIKALCRKARFHPKQVVCYCTATRAEEVAAAVIAGAKTPDALVLATGIGAGCGIECNQPILRFLHAAGAKFERRKGSYQWYGRTATVWDVPKEVKETYPLFRFKGDQDFFERIISAPVEP